MVKQIMDIMHVSDNGLHRVDSLRKLCITQIRIIDRKKADDSATMEQAMIVLSVVGMLIRCEIAMIFLSELELGKNTCLEDG